MSRMSQKLAARYMVRGEKLIQESKLSQKVATWYTVRGG